MDTGSLLAQIQSLKDEIAKLRAEIDSAKENDLTKSIILEDKKNRLEEEKTILEKYFTNGYCLIL